jgi:hypothetical protein
MTLGYRRRNAAVRRWSGLAGPEPTKGVRRPRSWGRGEDGAELTSPLSREWKIVNIMAAAMKP